MTMPLTANTVGQQSSQALNDLLLTVMLNKNFAKPLLSGRSDKYS